MRDEQDDVIDELLRDHFRRELDPHVGRGEQSMTGSRPLPASRRPWVGLWVAGAIAAGAAIAWGVTARLAPVAPKSPSQVAATTFAPTGSDPVPIEQVVQKQTVDEGAVVVGDAGPARWVREKVVETTTFYDQDSHARVELTVPRERMML